MSYATTLTPFGWPIIVYLTLAGLACGATLIAVAFLHLDGNAKVGQSRSVVKTGLYLAIAAILIGSLFLVYDLGSSNRFYLNFFEFNSSSVIAWGTRIITLFVLLCALALLLLNSQGEGKPIGQLLTLLLVAFALMVGIYPAFVLAQAEARPLWDPLFLAPLFLVLGINTGFASVQLLTYRKWTEETLAKVKKLDVVIVLVEVVLFAALVAMAPVSPAAIERFFTGDLALWFWFGVVIVGWGLPVLAGLKNNLSGNAIVLTQLCFIFGAFALRTVIVFGGQGPQSFIGA